MTGYTVHTGSSLKFSDNWDKIFAKRKKKTARPETAKKTTAAKKRPIAKKAGAKRRGA
jgi:hypothetical protein